MNQSTSGSLLISVIGASGYVGGELLRYLSQHPAVNKLVACSTSQVGQPVQNTHPFLAGRLNLKFSADPTVAGPPDVVFYATPAAVAMTSVDKFLATGCTVIDCSPDFRLQNIDTWQHWYKTTHTNPELVTKAVYGLVELNRDRLVGAQLIAAPGCYATILQLAGAPITKALRDQGCTSVRIIADCASGTSGAGRHPDHSNLLLAEAGNNYQAYAIDGHRHTPEVLQGITTHASLEPQLDFIPHLLPIPRGMFATMHFIPDRKVTVDIAEILADAYASESFIDILPAGNSPQIAAVVNSNRCQLGYCASRLTVLAALDNLGKGAAGQAVQAMNVALGLVETDGLNG